MPEDSTTGHPLISRSTDVSEGPFARFRAWYAEAEKEERSDPTRMAVATVDASGRPHVRMVLLKAADERGFVFYTNLESPKAADLKANPAVELCIHWPDIDRQIRISGQVVPVSDADADVYFATRPRLSQLGAWASKQSQPMEGYWELEKAVAVTALRFPFGNVPRPPHWSGFRVVPERIEFWHQKPFRHHERTVFVKQGDAWVEQWLFP